MVTNRSRAATPRAPRPRKLKVRAYNRSENAVMAIPALRMSPVAMRKLITLVIRAHAPARLPPHSGGGEQWRRSLLQCHTEEQGHILVRVIPIVITAERQALRVCETDRR